MLLREFSGRDLGHSERQRGVVAILERPGGREPGVGEDPLQQSSALETSGGSHDIRLPRQAAWRGRDLKIYLTRL